MRIPTQSIGNGALVASRIVATQPRKLFSVVGYNSGAAQFIQVHESATLPAEAAVPKHSFPVGAAQFYSFDLGLVGEDLDAITICNSSTAATKTIGAADVSIQAILHA
jgi:hypothetical protein